MFTFSGEAQYRLAAIGFSSDVAEAVSELLVRHPSFVSPKYIAHSLARQGYNDKLRAIHKESPFNYVRACLLRSMGDAQDVDEFLPLFWSILENNNASETEKLMASEALLVCDRWQSHDTHRASLLISSETKPYLIKNYILIVGRAAEYEGVKIPDEIISLQVHDNSAIVVDAIQYVLCRDCAYLFEPPEPSELLNYYSQYYPDTEGELEHGQYYGGLYHS